MENVLEILNYLGKNTSQTDPNIKPFVILFSSILFLTLLSLLSFTNILIYFFSLYLTDNKTFLSKISKYPFLSKWLVWYRGTR